jgi:hypothetical protein
MQDSLPNGLSMNIINPRRHANGCLPAELDDFNFRLQIERTPSRCHVPTRFSYDIGSLERRMGNPRSFGKTRADPVNSTYFY